MSKTTTASTTIAAADMTPEARLLEAFARALIDMPNPKADAINPQFRKNGKGGEYVTLRALQAHARQHLGKQGISFTHVITRLEANFISEIMLIGHGARMAVGGIPMPTPKDMTEQTFGRMITYFKRQSLMAGLAITGDGFEVDDDGAAGSSAKPQADSSW